MLAAFATTVLFSISAVCAQRTTRALGGVEANFWRIIVATLMLGVWAHTVGQGFRGTALPWFLISGVIGFGLGDLALYQALPRLGSRLSILIMHCVAAPVAAATEWIWLGTRMSGVQVAAAGLVLVGVALALAPGRHLTISRRTFWIGISAAVLGAIGQAYGAVLSRVAYSAASKADESIDGMTAAYQRIVAGVALAAIAFAVARMRKGSRDRAEIGSKALPDNRHAPSGTRRKIWPWILVNALAGPAVGVAFYQWALKERGTGIVLPIVALTPLVIIPFSRYVEGERPRKRSLAGGVVAVAGVFVLAGGIETIKRMLAPR